MQTERELLRRVLPLWVPSVSLESPLTPVVEQIKELCIDYAKRILERQLREGAIRQAEIIYLPQGPTKQGTGVRQIKNGEVF